MDIQTLGNVKVGDILAVLGRSGVFYSGAYKPHHLETVTHITPKQIHCKDYRFDKNGNPLDSTSKYLNYKLTDDKIIIDGMLADRQAQTDAHEERERQKIERDARVTYQLARQLTGWGGSDEAIADLELLGEDYLHRIVCDIERSKNNSPLAGVPNGG